MAVGRRRSKRKRRRPETRDVGSGTKVEMAVGKEKKKEEEKEKERDEGCGIWDEQNRNMFINGGVDSVEGEGLLVGDLVDYAAVAMVKGLEFF
ncbi:hypothetical protein LOK49_LG13G01208 [Camellia lanceoleosa]|uniref:Uncharacterized protein n=1 Tax=Camellia lanceoleosa TaxID=1840588 RepID=A0ACC0FHT2_9ERIC|nr:hypothetical protein LOK49_LG13G01208 [Camellia lanceoleosa]